MAEDKKSWLRLQAEGAIRGGLTRAYETVRVDPERFLFQLRAAHGLPIVTFQGVYSVQISRLDDVAESVIRSGMKLAAAEGAGFGLGGILTPTGVGTLVETGKQKIAINGREYLLELPLKADVALIKAAKADKAGNLVFRKSARNFNPIMASAAKIVIVEAQEIVETGMIDPDEVITPGIFITYLVQG